MYSHRYHKTFILLLIFLQFLIVNCESNDSKIGDFNMFRDMNNSEKSAMSDIDNLLSDVYVDSSISFYFFIPFSDDYYTRIEIIEGNSKIISKYISNGNIDFSKSKDIKLSLNIETEIRKLIDKYEPYKLPSVEDAIVDDGYTVIVRTNIKNYNAFALRAFTKKGKKTAQYKFIDEYLKILRKIGIVIEIE